MEPIRPAWSIRHETARLHKIRVDVSANYVGEQSKPEEGHYAFSYTITIRNEGQVPARLLTRHWVITDANGKVKEVRGEGVVGEQPYLLPGQGFRYSSGAVLETPVGAMQGSYQMLADDGAHFDAPIAPFTRIAFSNVARVRIFEIRTSSRTSVTIRRPRTSP